MRSARKIEAWAIPDDIYAGQYRIDEAIKGLNTGNAPGLAARWQNNLPVALVFARRGLEIAISKASNAFHDVDLTAALDDWNHLAETSDAAAAAIRRMMIACARREPKSHSDLLHGLGASGLFHKFAAADRRPHIESAASILWEAQSLARDLAKTAHHFEQHLRSDPKNPDKPRLNPGKPDHRAFDLVIAETWAHLTGSRPGANPTGSPFQRFLVDAWHDAGGTIVEGSNRSNNHLVSAFLAGATEARKAFTDERMDEINGSTDWPAEWGPVWIPTS